VSSFRPKRCLPAKDRQLRAWRVVFFLFSLSLVSSPGLPQAASQTGATKPANSGQGGEAFPKARLDKILAIPATEQSILFVRVRDGKSLYEREPDSSVSPASVTKLFTTAAVLAKFGPAGTLSTKFFHTGTRNGGVVTGDLVVVGDGDPFVISEKLWQLAADMRHLGYEEFTGDIVVDDSLFAGPVRDESRRTGERKSENAYDAPVSAFGVNFNTLAIAVAPGNGAGKPARVGIDPYNVRGVTIDNNAKTTSGGGDAAVQATRFGADDTPRISVGGNVPLSAPIRKIYRSVSDPLAISGEYLRAFLEGAGIKVRGRVRAGKLPAGATPVIALEGYEMRRIAQGLNTFSNNYIADTLVKRLGARFSPQGGKADAAGSGTFDAGIRVMTSFLRDEVGIKSKFTLLNGSGLATGNRFSARDVVGLLLYMESRMDLYPEFLGSLPAYGWDGTVKKRGRRDLAMLAGQVRAKTGTLSEPISVAGLGGYFRHAQHGLVAFAMLDNGRTGKPQLGIGDLRSRQDEVLAEIFSN